MPSRIKKFFFLFLLFLLQKLHKYRNQNLCCGNRDFTCKISNLILLLAFIALSDYNFSSLLSVLIRVILGIGQLLRHSVTHCPLGFAYREFFFSFQIAINWRLCKMLHKVNNALYALRHFAKKESEKFTAIKPWKKLKKIFFATKFEIFFFFLVYCNILLPQ